MRNGPDDRDKAFSDTNILIYAYDPTDPTKHQRAQTLIKELLIGERLVISAQILNEFYFVSTRTYRSASLTHEKAFQIVRHLDEGCEVIPLTSQVTIQALEGLSLHGLSFWDALVWSAAKEAGAIVIYSEDFQHGRVLDGIKFTNPFL